MKKVLSIAMAAAIVFGFGCTPPTTCRSTVSISASAESARTTLSALKQKYPAGTTWTGPYNIEGWEFRRCIGYAALIANEMYGSFFIHWQHDTNMSNLKPGDVILTKYKTKYMGDGSNHAVVVVRVSGDDVYITDCNASNDNKIHWDTLKSKSYFSSTANWNNGINGVYHAPVEAPQDNINPAPAHTNEANISEGRYNLVNVGTGYTMNYAWGTSDLPIWMSNADGSPEQIFTLEHVGEGKYEMHINHSDGGVVNVYSGSPAVGDPITRYNDNNNDTQRFYFVNVGNDEYIIENAANPNAVIGSPSGELHAKLKLCKYSEGDSSIRWKLNALDTSSIEPITPKLNTISVSLYGGNDTKLTDADVFFTSGDTKYTSDIHDNTYYSSMPAGNYILYANKTGYVSKDIEFKAEFDDLVMRVELHHPGDVSGDEKIDIDDAITVINSVNGVKAIEDNYDRKVANVADDDSSGSIDIEDAVAIINHINGISPLY